MHRYLLQPQIDFVSAHDPSEIQSMSKNEISIHIRNTG